MDKTYFHFYDVAYSKNVDAFEEGSSAEFEMLGPMFSTLEEAQAASDTIKIVRPDIKRINILYEVFSTDIDAVENADSWEMVTCNTVHDEIKDNNDWID